MPPQIQRDGSTVTPKDNPKKNPAATGASSTNPNNKESSNGSPHIADRREESTPPPHTQTSTPTKNLATKGKEVSTGSHEEHGYGISPPPPPTNSCFIQTSGVTI